MPPMTVRERLRALLRGEAVDRLPVVEWATYWDQTVARWRSEGLPAELREHWEIAAHFGLDVWKQAWFSPIGPGCPRAAGQGEGIVSDAAGYERILPHLYPEVDVSALERWRAEHDRGDIAIWFTFDGFFWFARTVLGIEPHLTAFYEQPELLHRINGDLAAWMIRSIDAIARAGEPELMTFAEDMSYKSGPMLSERLFDEFMLPYFRRVVPELERRAIVPIADSDGDVTKAIPWFVRAGIKGLLPMERRAGVDVAAIRRSYPDLIMIGGFDKSVMAEGDAAIRAELERLLPVARTGRFAISVDHQTPPHVSLAVYRRFVELLREYAEKMA
jgi:hypothetical protein